MAIGEA